MIKIDPDQSIAVIELEGVVELPSIFETIKALLSHPGHQTNMDELWDLRRASGINIQTEDLLRIAEEVKRYQAQLAKRIAIVADSELEYGLSRMWISHVEHEMPKERRVFRRIEEAYDWLSG